MGNKVLAFGEIMLRLTPTNNNLINDCKNFDVYYGGTEANVLAGLSVFGEKTEYLTALPENELGDAVLKHLKSYGVGTEYIKRYGSVLGMYFLEEGFGDRQNNVIYNRSNSEITRLDEDSFDCNCIFQDCSIFHISGISFALSESVKKLCFKLLEEAKKRNILISFDFNYRSKLWSIEAAGDVYRKIIPYADIVFCSEKDLNVFLYTTASDFYDKYECKYLIVREREILPDGKHRAYVQGCVRQGDIVLRHQTEPYEFSVCERIGAGDAFDAGVLHIINNNGNLEDAIKFGMSSFVLKHTIRGDVFTLNKELINNHINKSLGDVFR